MVRSPGAVNPGMASEDPGAPVKSVPRLRPGHSTIIANRDPDPEPRNLEPPGRPTHRARPGVADRRGGGVRTRLRAPGPASSAAAPRDPHPTSPPPPGLTAPAASLPRLHPAPPRAAAPALHGHRLLRAPAASRAEQTPCFCFESATPPRGGARDSARRDPLSRSRWI